MNKRPPEHLTDLSGTARRCAICEQRTDKGRMRRSAVHNWLFLCPTCEAKCVARGWLPVAPLEGE